MANRELNGLVVVVTRLNEADERIVLRGFHFDGEAWQTCVNSYGENVSNAEDAALVVLRGDLEQCDVLTFLQSLRAKGKPACFLIHAGGKIFDGEALESTFLHRYQRARRTAAPPDSLFEYFRARAVVYSMSWYDVQQAMGNPQDALGYEISQLAACCYCRQADLFAARLGRLAGALDHTLTSVSEWDPNIHVSLLHERLRQLEEPPTLPLETTLMEDLVRHVRHKVNNEYSAFVAAVRRLQNDAGSVEQVLAHWDERNLLDLMRLEPSVRGEQSGMRAASWFEASPFHSVRDIVCHLGRDDTPIWKAIDDAFADENYAHLREAVDALQSRDHRRAEDAVTAVNTQTLAKWLRDTVDKLSELTD